MVGVPGGLSAPLVVCVHHEVAGQVVAALLARPVVAEENSSTISFLISVNDRCEDKSPDEQGNYFSLIDLHPVHMCL